MGRWYFSGAEERNGWRWLEAPKHVCWRQVGLPEKAYFYLIIAGYTNTDWWFGTFFIFPYIGNSHPNWLSYFSEGLKPPTRILLIWYYYVFLVRVSVIRSIILNIHIYIYIYIYTYIYIYIYIYTRYTLLGILLRRRCTLSVYSRMDWGVDWRYGVRNDVPLSLALHKAILRPGDRVLESDAQGFGGLGRTRNCRSKSPFSIGDFVPMLAIKDQFYDISGLEIHYFAAFCHVCVWLNTQSFPIGGFL